MNTPAWPCVLTVFSNNHGVIDRLIDINVLAVAHSDTNNSPANNFFHITFLCDGPTASNTEYIAGVHTFVCDGPTV